MLNLQTADNLATTLTAEYDASPCVDRGGYNVICVQDGQAKSVITQDNTSTTLNASHEQPIIFCAADDNGKTAVNEDLSGSLKVGGGRSLNSTGRDYIEALCARDFKGVGSQYVTEGKIILQEISD